jgi:hypothetical protein
MADYHPLITRAVDGLANNTAEARRTLYERARAALVAQLRGIEPPLSEAEITRERLALEDAIRKIEADSVRKARSEPRPAAPRTIQPLGSPSGTAAAPPPPSPGWRERPVTPGDMSRPTHPDARFAEPARKEPSPPSRQPEPLSGGAESPTSARSRLLEARSPQRPRDEFRGFRAAADEFDESHASQKMPVRGAQEAYQSLSARQSSDLPVESWGEGGAEHFDDEQSSDLLEDTGGLEQAYDLDDQDQLEPGRPQPRRPSERAEHYRQPRRPRSYRGLVKLVATLIIIVGIGAMISWQWPKISALYDFVSHLRSRPTQTAQPPAGEPKFGGRVPQEQGRQPPAAAAPKTPSGPAVAQRVVLYEEDPSNPQGKQYIGSALWRTETVSPGSGLAPEVQIRADVTVPERNTTVTWTLRRNTDQALPASHTIEIMFNLPTEFAGGGIANVPGVLMKESEQARGVPLAGLAVKVTNGFFLIGLSAVDADVQRNMQLLKDRAWFDIPIVYNNGGRAILALEKGPSGERAFADAFAAWGK